MAEEMTNIEIRDFLTVSGAVDTDFVVLSLTGGTSAKIAVGTFQSSLINKVTPSIKDGMWWIGEVNQEIVAEGQTPVFRKTDLGIEWKYTNQSDLAWTLLVPISDILFKFDELTDDQRDLIKLKYSDLTESEIKELQQPANDMIAALEATNAKVTTAETAREEAEEARVEEFAEMKTSITEATTAATTATANAEAATASANKAADAANASSKAADESAASADESAAKADTAADNADTAADNANTAADTANASAQLANTSADSADSAAQRANDAAADAQDTADHPTYIGEDNYVYEWDKAAQTYNKTSKYVRGEAFSIKKTYSSTTAMYEDTETEFKEGDFCLINTGSVEDPETGRLYVRSAVGSWDFLVDMSGAIGFTGKTPQLFVGTVAVGSGKDSAAVTLTSAGTDTDGNPQYNINYVIPCLAYEDLTEEQIAELQRPASDMITKLQATDDSVKAAEELRVAAEEERVEEFSRLKSESETATSDANTATMEANEARGAANEAAQNANDSANAANVAAESANEATTKANTATLSANAAAESANNAANTADVSAQRADVAADNANTAASGADSSAVKADAATLNANTAATEANTARDTANEAAQRADESADKADSATSNANAATDAANTAALKARNLPIIQGGTWWLYDVDADTYVDTGYAVSSDYQLTREKIEGVFTGNVESHWHDRYVDKVDGKQLSTEDFTTTEKEKLESLENYDDTAVKQQIAAKQDSISDLDSIRSGASLGATALQEVPSEYITDTELSAKGYATTAQLSEGLSGKADAVAGKQLSTEDFTSVLKSKLEGLENYDDSAITSVVNVLREDFDTLVSGDTTSAIEAFNEIVAFLAGVEDTENLEGIVASIEQQIAAKQDVIGDLETIRSGAALGTTALQSVPEEYITETELETKGYATETQLSEGLSTKQEKNLYFTNLTASVWVEDDTYADFKYRCDLYCPGVTADYYAEVVFAMEQFTSVDYAPICETKQDIVSIWADVNDEIVIPTVIVYK